MKISEVSSDEYVRIVSTYWFRVDQNFNCAMCKKQFSEGVRDSRKACFTRREKEIVNYNGLIKYFVCPSNFFNSAYSQVIDMFRHFQAGALPFSGGLMEQPAKIIEMFKIIESLDAEKAKDADRSKKWQKTQSRSNSRSTNRKL